MESKLKKKLEEMKSELRNQDSMINTGYNIGWLRAIAKIEELLKQK